MNNKRILSIFMALCVIAGLVLGIQTEVSAKTKKTVKLTFNGKSITLDTDRGQKNRQEPKTLSEVENKLGKKTRKGTEKDGGYGETYVWKKGKTKIVISEDVGGNGLGYASIEINDKNGSMDGLKVGMSKDKAVKKLKNAYGSKHVQVSKNSLFVDNTVVFSVDFKNGKVSSISWMRS